MTSKDLKVRSFAMVLFFTAPFALAEAQQTSGGLSPSAAADLLFQLETLQQEVQSLRGQLENQGHELKLMKESQRDRYIDLDKRISELEKYKTKDIIVICNMGQTAGTACKKLMAAGFEKVVRLKGGITEWKAQNLPLVK